MGIMTVKVYNEGYLQFPGDLADISTFIPYSARMQLTLCCWKKAYRKSRMVSG